MSRAARPAPAGRAPRAPRALLETATSAWRERLRMRPGTPERRQRILMGIVLVVLCVFAARLVYIQLVQGPSLAQAALQGRVLTGEIPAVRGDIVDAEGEVLATSVERYDIIVDLTLVAEWKRIENGEIVGTGPAAAAEVLAPVLGLDAPELAADLVGTSRGKYIAKEVLPDTWRAIKALNVTGVAAERTTVREYPNGATAGNIIGFVNSEGIGSAGLEQTFDSVLTGTPGSYLMEQSLRGHQIPTGVQEETAAQAGLSTQLTTINDLQWKAQDAIDEAKRKTGATYGSIVIEDLRTGDLLALAETDTVDPNDLGASDPATWGSRAVSNVFEPGSTAKVITMAAALETGVADPLSQFEVPDRYTTSNGETFKDSHDHEKLKLTLAGIFAESSNTGTVQIAELLTPQVRYDYLRKFGFGERTGIGLPGESAGILHPVERWDGRTQYTVSFGQGLAVNAIQANEVFAIIGNGGVRAHPRLVKGYTDESGTFTPHDAGAQTRVVSEETADAVLAMMETAVSDGTGVLAQIPGYRVAGKTGTAQAANPATGTYDHFVASFNGVVPADEPRLAVSVALNYPSLEYGGVVAAPVFADVSAFALQYLGIEPSKQAAEPFATTWE